MIPTGGSFTATPGLPFTLPTALPSAFTQGRGTTVAPPPTPPAVGVAAYTVRVVNPARQVVGAITGYRKLALAERYNNVSDWEIELDASDPNAALLMTPGYGISITRTVYNLVSNQVIRSAVELAGPVRGVLREFATNSLTLSGKDYLFMVSTPRAWPVNSYQYAATVLALPGVARYYRLGDKIGTSATDSGPNHYTGTYHGGTVLNIAGLIDDTDSSVQFDGATGYLSAPTAGLPTGNPSALAHFAWVRLNYLPTNPNVVTVVEYGAAAAGQALSVLIDYFGFVKASIFGTATAAVQPSITPGSVHLVGATWDGTNLTAWLDGVAIATMTPGPMSIPASGLNYTVGQSAASGGTNWVNGRVDETVTFTTVPTAAQVQALYALGLARFAVGTGYDTLTGPAETVVKHYVNANIGPTAFSERQVAGLAVEADAGRGTSVTGNARFDRLVALDGTGLLQQLALSGGIGFKLTTVNGVLTFQVYQTTDRSSSIIFAQNLGNLIDFKWERKAPDPDQGGNVVIVGGGGVAAQRIMQLRTDPTSVTTWGRTEFFLDARDTSDVPTLQQRGDAHLAASKEQDTFSAVLTPMPGMQYGVNFFLGDKVTIVVDGVPYSDLIREVDITLDQGQAEVVTPIMASPNAIVVQDASIGLYRRLQAQLGQIARLQHRV